MPYSIETYISYALRVNFWRESFCGVRNTQSSYSRFVQGPEGPEVQSRFYKSLKDKYWNTRYYSQEINRITQTTHPLKNENCPILKQTERKAQRLQPYH